MNLIKKIAVGFITINCFMISCTKKFEEINTDPNRIDQISPGTLLNPIIYDAASFGMDRSAAINFELMQLDQSLHIVPVILYLSRLPNILFSRQGRNSRY